MHVNESRVTSCLQNTRLWIYGLVWISVHVCGCMPVQLCVHAHVQHACLRARWLSSVHTGACEQEVLEMRVYVLRSCCPHAHPRLRAASILLTCASPNRARFARSLQESSQHHNKIASPHRSKYCRAFWLPWRDTDSSRLGSA